NFGQVEIFVRRVHGCLCLKSEGRKDSENKKAPASAICRSFFDFQNASAQRLQCKAGIIMLVRMICCILLKW
ncbi:MAG: hypothetical protein KAX50_06625, partial [Saprospiraceae bacterium]|nr:hypothetical protein [Saprospiraceae bacterium]